MVPEGSKVPPVPFTKLGSLDRTRLVSTSSWDAWQACGGFRPPARIAKQGPPSCPAEFVSASTEQVDPREDANARLPDSFINVLDRELLTNRCLDYVDRLLA